MCFLDVSLYWRIIENKIEKMMKSHLTGVLVEGVSLGPMGQSPQSFL